MARGQRRSDEEIILELDNDITEMNSRKEKIDLKIKELQQKKQDILDGKRQKEAEELLAMIENSGMSMEEIKDLLRNKAQIA